ncbi:MAG: hypothetical protein IPI38_05575 [Gemmatimonadetes bacterium]|nr:hypothetical protein [Gemmatimonadota bacterium]
MLRPRRCSLMPALLALLATLTLSCATGEDPTAPAMPAVVPEAPPADSRLLQPLLNGLLACYPQPYAAASQVIGPAGGPAAGRSPCPGGARRGARRAGAHLR